MRGNSINTLRLAALTVCAIAALLCAREARAATFTVTAITDAPDAVPGDGKCETGPGNGVCTLRAAVMETNALAGEDEIRLPADNFVLTRIGEDDTALNGDLDITGRLAIHGVQSDTTQVIGGAGLGARIFQLHPQAVVSMTGFTIRNSENGGIHVAQVAELALENMVIRENRAFGSGGGVLNFGSVHIRRSVVIDNTAKYGGGIAATDVSRLTIVEDSTIQENRADQTGGGIYSDGDLTIQNSLIQGNEAGSGAGIAAFNFPIVIDSRIFSNTATSDYDPLNGLGGGGGLLLSGGLIADSHIAWNTAVGIGGGVATSNSYYGDATTITIVRTTISNNRANAAGGGIHKRHQSPFQLIDSAVVDNSAVIGGGIHRNGGGISIINTTISGNVAAGRGGGIALELNVCTGFCTVGLYNATVANNTAASASDGVYVAPGVQLRAQNSIIANNNDADCEGTILSGGHNLIENTSGCSFLGLAIDDVLGVDPKLGRLALNGGPTLNHLPGRGSPAINAGNPGGCSSPAGATLITDQRGLPRTAGRRCDIGAVEVQPEAAPEWLVFLPIVMR